MKIIDRRTHCSTLNFMTANDKFAVSLNFKNGPQLKLADNSLIVFNNTSAYYSAIAKNIVNTIFFDESKLVKESVSIKTDDVNNIVYEGEKIVECTKYVINNNAIYKFKMG